MLTNFQVHSIIFTFVYKAYLGQNDVILAKNDVIAPQGEIGEVWKLPCKYGLWVYIYEYKHQNSIQYIVLKKK